MAAFRSLCAVLAVLLCAAACRVEVAPYEDRECNEANPCLERSGRQCVRGLCQLPWDGGVYPVPSASTTGVLAYETLTPSGPLRITQAGRVVEGLDVSGCVSVEADGVVLRNLRIRTDGVCKGSNLLDVRGAKGTVVEDVEIDGTGHGEVYAVMGGEVILRRVHIHDVWTGIRVTGNGVQLLDSLVHRFTSTVNAGAFVTSGGSDFTLRHNVLEVSGNGDSVITLYSQDSAIKNVLAEANLINGAGWSVSAGGGNSALPTSNVRFLRNRFGKKYHPKCGFYGPVSSFETGRPGNQWEGNVWDDSSEPISP